MAPAPPIVPVGGPFIDPRPGDYNVVTHYN